ncbi:hypothetical protein ACEWY4_021517 [Coilia grayii]|uniref:HAT C-terminal dimerisation domain-containing protein n=1 Tax=Coilia grayii TaxID=363190 RepID=A0ABD1J9L2_9TELE
MSGEAFPQPYLSAGLAACRELVASCCGSGVPQRVGRVFVLPAEGAVRKCASTAKATDSEVWCHAIRWFALSSDRVGAPGEAGNAPCRPSSSYSISRSKNDAARVVPIDFKQAWSGKRSRFTDLYRICNAMIRRRWSLSVTTLTNEVKTASARCAFGLRNDKPAAFPSNELLQLTKTYPFFDEQRLRNELRSLYNNELFHKSPGELLQLFIEDDLQSTLSEVYKLLQLMLTIPATSTSAERSFSCLKRIKTYLRNTCGQDRLVNLAKISINSVVVDDLKASGKFYDAVIDHFAEMKDRRMAFLFK